MEVRKLKSTQLTDDAVSALQKALKDTKESSDNARLSKNYINKVLDVNIGDRGGIVILREDKKHDHSIWAIVKSQKSQYMRPSGKAELLGPPGGFAKAKIIENVVTGERKALKVLSDSGSELLSEFKHEAQALGSLGLGYSFIIEKKYADDEEHEDKNHHPAIIMDIAPGEDLFNILKKGILTPLERINIFLDLLDFVQLMHKLGFIHMDLKPENIMYDLHNKEVNIIDFGATRKIDSERSSITTPGYIPPDLEHYNNCKPDFDIFALARIAREIFHFGILLQFQHGTKYLGCDPVAVRAFSKDERFILSQIILDMESEKRILLQNAIDRMKEFKNKWLKGHHHQRSLELKSPDKLTFKMKLKSKLYPPTLFAISPEEKKTVSKQSILANHFNQFAEQLETYSKQERCKLLRRNLASELANKLTQHAAILTNPIVNIEQQVCIATQTIQAIELTMWKLFQKTEPGQIKKGYWSTRKKSAEDLSISNIFANCQLNEWRELKNALDTDFQVWKKIRT